MTELEVFFSKFVEDIFTSSEKQDVVITPTCITPWLSSNGKKLRIAPSIYSHNDPQGLQLANNFTDGIRDFLHLKWHGKRGISDLDHNHLVAQNYAPLSAEQVKKVLQNLFVKTNVGEKLLFTDKQIEELVRQHNNNLKKLEEKTIQLKERITNEFLTLFIFHTFLAFTKSLDSLKRHSYFNKPANKNLITALYFVLRALLGIYQYSEKLQAIATRPWDEGIILSITILQALALDFREIMAPGLSIYMAYAQLIIFAILSFLMLTRIKGVEVLLLELATGMLAGYAGKTIGALGALCGGYLAKNFFSYMCADVKKKLK